jgi:predicted metal-dependent hydrolase
MNSRQPDNTHRQEQLDLFNAAAQPGEAAAQPGEAAAAPRKEPEKTAQPCDTFAIRHRAEALHAELEKRTGMKIQLRVNNNTSTMMTIRYNAGRKSARVNLHHMFSDAPEPVLRALAQWIEKPRAKAAGRTINGWIRSQRHRIAEKPARKSARITRGRFHDLQREFDQLNRSMFNSEIRAAITWGSFRNRGRRKSIRFGSYSESAGLIRIHPLLDQKFVPAWFVRYIIFHEMLHAALGTKSSPSGRRQVHSREFRELEKKYPDYGRAEKWIQDSRNMRRLLKPAPFFQHHDPDSGG